MSDFLRPTDLSPDPVVTEWAVEAGSGPGFVADAIAPVVPVTKKSFKFATYGNDELNDETETLAKAGVRPNRVRQQPPSYTEKGCTRYALDDFLSDDLLELSPSIEQRRSMKLGHKLALGIEKRVKALLDANGTEITTPSVKWDATSGTIVIEKNIDTARESHAITARGEATHIVIPPAVARAMKRDATIRDLRKYTEPGLLVNGDLPPVLFGMRVVIPGALHNSGNPKADFAQTVARIWATDSVYLLTVDPSYDLDSFTAIGQAHFSEFGARFAGFRWRDSHLSVRGLWLSAEVYQSEFLVSANAITRIPDVLT
jgi:hypothetical protein